MMIIPVNIKYKNKLAFVVYVPANKESCYLQDQPAGRKTFVKSILSVQVLQRGHIIKIIATNKIKIIALAIHFVCSCI